MLRRPQISDRDIIKSLYEAYELEVEELTFLPLGADFNTAVYCVRAKDKQDYFLKLRSGHFLEASVAVPKYLSDVGFNQVIAPLSNKLGNLWTQLNSFKLILYPYIDGYNGVETPLTDHQWVQFGGIIKKLHCCDMPQSITSGVPEETFTSKALHEVKIWLERTASEDFKDPIAKKLALFLNSKRKLILSLIQRTQECGSLLQKRQFQKVLCHADIHGWNILIDNKGDLYLVDWDTLAFAPKERDLMFIGAGIHDTGRTRLDEEALFYKGYGITEVHQDRIAYFRYQRIIEDISEYCNHIFLSEECEKDRVQSLIYLQANFLPSGTIEAACKCDRGWECG